MAAQIVSIALGVCAAGLLIYAFTLFVSASHLASSANAHPNAAEDQSHGLDGLGATLAGGFGFGILLAALVLLSIAVTGVIATERKLRLKPRVDMPATTPDVPVHPKIITSGTGNSIDQSAKNGDSEHQLDQ
jgi:predicted lipid-binding transport protein (Tim44 family)